MQKHEKSYTKLAADAFARYKLTVIDIGVDKEGYSQLDEVVVDVLDVDLLVPEPLTHSAGVPVQLLHPTPLDIGKEKPREAEEA